MGSSSSSAQVVTRTVDEEETYARKIDDFHDVLRRSSCHQGQDIFGTGSFALHRYIHSPAVVTPSIVLPKGSQKWQFSDIDFIIRNRSPAAFESEVQNICTALGGQATGYTDFVAQLVKNRSDPSFVARHQHLRGKMICVLPQPYQQIAPCVSFMDIGDTTIDQHLDQALPPACLGYQLANPSHWTVGKAGFPSKDRIIEHHDIPLAHSQKYTPRGFTFELRPTDTLYSDS